VRKSEAPQLPRGAGLGQHFQGAGLEIAIWVFPCSTPKYHIDAIHYVAILFSYKMLEGKKNEIPFNLYF
jgi:hypothetical protein